MKALLLKAYGDFVFQEVPEPRVHEDEVLIRVSARGICGSDVHGMDGSTGRRRPPIIMGHEASGVIAEVGEKVTGWNKGDRVTFDSTVFCGACWFCQRGLINLCDDRRVTLVGNLKPSVELPLQTVVTRQITLYGSCASSGEYPACLDLMARGAINTEALISATPPLAEGAAWFKRLYDREPGLMKVILIP
jgi:threonine dehydrogenase-like Zn-dependent dehydrogenase